MCKLFTASLVVLTLATACAQKAKPASDQPAAAPHDAAAPAPTMESEDARQKRPEVTIQPAGPGDLGEHKVIADGMSVWPPAGPGCEPLVACCRAAAALDRAMGLACQLSVARQTVDCGKARAMMRRLIGERKMAVPGPCALP